MAGLLTALQINAQSLDAQSQGVQLAGKNISNANNASYARQVLNITDGTTIETSVGPQAGGASASGITQERDPFLDAQMTREIAQTNQLQALNTNLTNAQADLGESISTSADSSINSTQAGSSGISSAINSFFNDVQSLSASPSSPGAKQALLEQANTLSTQINQTYSALQTDQSNIDSQASSDVTSANTLLQNIAQINGQIASFETNAPGSAVDLRDQRQADLEKLAQYMDFTATEVPNSNGQMTVVANSANGPVTLINQTTVTGALTYDASTSQVSCSTSGGTGTALDVQGGSLAGAINAKTGAIATLMQNIQATAQQLTISVNGAYQSGGGTNNFFSSSPTTGIIAVDPSLTIDSLTAGSTGDAGANDLAQAIAAVGTKSFSTAGSPPDLIDGTITSFYNSSATGFASSVSNSNSQLTEQQTVQSLVKSQRDSVSGVNSDEEETNLIQYQKGYEGVAKVISTLDTMLSTVLAMGGAAT